MGGKDVAAGRDFAAGHALSRRLRRFWRWPTPINFRRTPCNICIGSWAGLTTSFIAAGGLSSAKWIHMLLFEVPKTIFHDRCVQVMFCVFWGLFILSAYLAYSKAAWPDFAEQVLTSDGIQSLEKMYEKAIGSSDRGGDTNMFMAGFYMQHNTGIGLQCFAWGLLVVPGMLVTMFNAISLGAAFGYMARPEWPRGKTFLIS